MTEIEKSELLAALVGTPHRDMMKGYFMANDALVAQIDAFIAQRGEIHKVIDTMTGTRPGTDDLENPAFRLSRMLVDARPSQEPRPMSEAPRDGTDILGQMRNGERRICCWAWSVSMWVPSEPLGWWPRSEMAKQAKTACAGLPTSSGGEGE